MRRDAHSLIDARAITAHSPPVVEDELGMGNLADLGNIVVFEDILPFPEPCRNADAISYTHLRVEPGDPRTIDLDRVAVPGVNRVSFAGYGPVIRFLIRANSGLGRFKDALNRYIQHGIILRIGLLDRQPFHQRPREARHDAVIPTEAGIAFFQGVPPRQRNDFQNFRMSDAISVKVVLLRQRDLEHDRLTRRQFVELFK